MTPRQIVSIIERMMEAIADQDLEISLNEVLEEAGGFVTNGEIQGIVRASTYDNAMLLTTDLGVIVETRDGRVFITVK